MAVEVFFLNDSSETLCPVTQQQTMVRSRYQFQQTHLEMAYQAARRL